MSFLRVALTTALFILYCSLASAADSPPSAETIRKNLDGLAERQLSEAEKNQAQQALEQSLSLLQERSDSEQRLTQLLEQLRQAPQQIEQARRELAQLQALPAVDIAQEQTDSSPQELEQLLAERSAQLNAWQQQIIEANSLVINAQIRPERAQTEIAANQARTQQINTALKSERLDDRPLTPELRTQLNAEMAMLAAQTRLRREELAANSLLQDLGSSRRELLDERIRRAEQERLALQELINEKRRAESQQTVEEQSQQVRRTYSSDLLAQESAHNLRLSDYLLEVTNRLNQRTQQNLQTQQQLDNLAQTRQTLDEQISVLEGSLLLSKILYQQKEALPRVSQARSNLADEIADLRLYQFDLNQQREAIAQPERYIDQLLAEHPPSEAQDRIRVQLQAQLTTRRDLLERLNRSLDALLSESITLQLNRTELAATAASLRTTLDQQMFWLPSNRPLDLHWLRNVPQRANQQLEEIAWSDAINDLFAGLAHRPQLFLPLLLLIGLLLWQRRRLGEKLGEIGREIGHYRLDSQLHTPLALLLCLLQALPGALFLGLCAYALQEDMRGHNANLSNALFQMAQAWLVFYTLYRILAPGGVAELHFRWEASTTGFLRRKVRHLGLVILALVAVVSFAENRPASLADDAIGILVVIPCYALASWLMLRLLLDNPEREKLTALRQAAGIAFSLLPLALIVALLFGYYYTALRLTDRLIETLYLLLIWLLLEASFVRGLGVAARRLAYQRAQAQRLAESENRDHGETESVVETPILDMQQVNQQSLRLIRLALFGIFLVSLYWVWADLIRVFTYLDNITLYEYTTATGLQPISLLDALGALIIVGLTLILARNLPGLLEVLVLSRLQLAQGSAYATTTLLSYVLIGIGIVTTLATLGVSWDKLQWLVAALSVGLGFGLQAIFANFVSGLIILFERPVRIGDLVTIGGVTGTVKHIQIRATHIIDSDRKAVIVPNQTFITSQLINWTLVDSITRLVLTFVVNRGADLEQVRELLLQASLDNPRVMRDPAPSAQLTQYGASSLTFELKIYVRELGDRGPATDELNRRVDQLFSEHGINVSSVPKMDVYLQRRDGSDETRIETTEPH
ncbi:mechanosensitive channel MscK [Pseudomonas sp. NCCP-436]|uniref:mechanosensitive channel MscK n=1 Tax=Pseudomonas sp. NCCP-436 TaxID=2842481 RepID=UPI001C820412|nr:mechanosensitive channel MscK [Pseudomonas sp. NCCP-436]GIZ12808.1 potassium transporter KefA [Pseudomonas sp. NCCP-436]